MATTDIRITRLLNQLEDPDLTETQIAAIKEKIGFIESKQMRA